MGKVLTPIMGIVFVVISIICLNWYSNINKVDFKIKDYKEVLSTKELLELDRKGELLKPVNHNKVYFTKRKVTYRITRSKFPLKYNKEIATDSGISYWSKDPE